MNAPSNSTPTLSVVELLGAMLVRVVMDICGRVSWGGITQPQSSLLYMRLNGIKRRIDRIVASIRAGTYKPRRRTGKPRARASPREPRQPSPLPAKFGWLMPLIPRRKEEYWHANSLRGTFELQLNHPEMVALVEAAPVSLGRPLRSLCWAFRLEPPPFLAPPKRKVPTADAPKPEAAEPESPPAASCDAAPEPPPPPARSPRRAAGRSRRPPVARARGSPHPA